MRILAAGDHFVTPELLTRELTAEIGTAHTIDEMRLPWPLTPFGRVAEVDEASGDEETLLAALDGARICVTQMAPVTRKVLDGSPDLRLVVVGRGGPVNVDLDAAKEHGVQVCNTPGRNAAATAEYTVGLLLATMRRIPETSAALAEGRWAGEFYIRQLRTRSHAARPSD